MVTPIRDAGNVVPFDGPGRDLAVVEDCPWWGGFTAAYDDV